MENKLTAQWTPNLQQEIEALINPNSPFYAQEVVDAILKDYTSIVDFKASDEYQKLNNFTIMQ